VKPQLAPVFCLQDSPVVVPVGKQVLRQRGDRGGAEVRLGGGDRRFE
jgi:hypothetical protein